MLREAVECGSTQLAAVLARDCSFGECVSTIGSYPFEPFVCNTSNVDLEVGVAESDVFSFIVDLVACEEDIELFSLKAVKQP